MSSRANARCPAPPRSRGGLLRQSAAIRSSPGEIARGSGTPARRGSRRSRRARRTRRAATAASWRTPRAARRGWPSGFPRTPRRGSARGGTGTCPLSAPSSRTGSDEALPREREQPGRDLRPIGGRREVGDRTLPELLADDGGPLERASLSGLEAVEPRGEQRLDRAGQRETIDVLRVRTRGPSRRTARRRAGFPRPSPRSCGVISTSSTPSDSTQLVGLVVGELRELDERVPRPGRARLEQVRAWRCTGARSGRSPNAATYSTRSSIVGSAQWMSSRQTSSGRSWARLSSTRLMPQKSSSLGATSADSPSRGREAARARRARRRRRRIAVARRRRGRRGRARARRAAST